MSVEDGRRATTSIDSNRALAATLLLTTTALSAGLHLLLIPVAPVMAQSAPAVRSFNIAPQSLSSALRQFADQSGMQLAYRTAELRDINSPGFSGSAPNAQALARLLAGTGVTYNLTGTNTVTIQRPSVSAGIATVEGAIQLDTVNVSGGRTSATEAPYSTPAPVAHISEQTIERFRGSSPADIFRGVPGVMSGEARNGGGGIDVNIRGMQGMGRVAVTVDGAENGVSVYQGYQGASNRTFVDPDLLAGVDIQKGSDVASRGIAGTVTMRTVGADDIVKQGEKWGVRVKGGFGSNTSAPMPGALGGYYYLSGPGIALPSSTGMDRPGFLKPTSGSASAVAAIKEENYDLLWGYAWRKQGNYHAGKYGPAANPVNIGTTTDIWGLPQPNTMVNGGLTNYRAGEEVLNTQLETESWLAKGTLRFENGHSVQLGYTGFRGEVGDLLASRFTGNEGQPIQQQQTAGTKLDTGTLRYRWKPDNNDLVDLKANLWLTNLELRNPRRGAPSPTPESLGLPWDFRTGSDTRMWGGDITNKSAFAFDYGKLDFTYGLSYLNEDTHPSAYTNALEGWLNLRDGTREEAATFGKVAYKPFEWLTLNGGLRYSHFWSEDRRTTASTPEQLSSEPRRNDGGFSPSAGMVVEPIKGTQFYVNYSNALRFPSLMEAVSAFTLIVNNDLRPERASNWDAGVNVIRDGVFAAGDKAMMKFGWFNWDISNYIAREFAVFQNPGGSVYQGMHIYNIDRAKFSGLEFSSRYEVNGFTAELAANYYLGVEFCRTANTCESKSIYSDYATNHVPPKYMANLTVSQKLFEDALTVGGRISHIGPRAIGHGAVTAQGAAQFIEMIKWKPYWLVDVFAEYKLDETWTASARIENLFDRYYVDPLGLVNQPSPGRTFYASLTGKFGGPELGQSSLPVFDKPVRGNSTAGWSGFYLGGYGGFGFPKISGVTTAMNDPRAAAIGDESPNMRLRGASFGAQAGFNYQFSNRLIAGIEADIGSLQIAGYRNKVATESGLQGTQQESQLSSEIDWISTVRGRLGYAVNDRLMLYVTGGAAFMEQEEKRTQYINDPRNGTSTISAFTERDALMRTGYAIGGGAEYALDGGWSLKGEFLLAIFGQKEAKFPDARAGVKRDTTALGNFNPTLPGCDFATNFMTCFETVVVPGTYSQTVGRKVLSKLNIPMIKIGLSYRF